MLIKMYAKYTPSPAEVLRKIHDTDQLRAICEISEIHNLSNLYRIVDDALDRLLGRSSPDAPSNISMERIFQKDAMDLQTTAELHQFAVDYQLTMLALATQDHMLSPAFGEDGRILATNIFRTSIIQDGKISSEIGTALFVNLYGNPHDGLYAEERAFERCILR